jgi:putative ABC transport system substrate-binding protein
MKRREFITLLGSGAVAWPLTAHAQQPALPVIGFLHPTSPAAAARQMAGFYQGLKETGYVEGQNVAIEYRWAEGHSERLPALAADLVRRGVAMIVATGGFVAALAAKAATSTIPIVFNGGNDPVKFGLVASFNRPGGNITGVVSLDATLAGKQLELLRKLVPDASLVAVLTNPDNADRAESFARDLQEAAHSMGQQLLVLTARAQDELDAAFVTMAQQKAETLLVASDAFFFSQRNRLAALATQHRIPAIYIYRDYAAAGGLMSYGTSLPELYRQVGVYTGRILKGAKPTELPVIQSARFEFVINLKTARALGLTVPPTMLSLADEVIE